MDHMDPVDRVDGAQTRWTVQWIFWLPQEVVPEPSFSRRAASWSARSVLTR